MLFGCLQMQRLPTLLRRFSRDESGMFAVLFGLTAIVLIATAGAVVDYVTVQQTRSRAQIALDAATLALQPEIFKPAVSQETIKQRAQALMLERIGNSDVKASVTGIKVDVENGSLLLTAEMTVPTVFVRLVGVNSLTAGILSEATRKKLELEIVMVLDNSGSMKDYNRMTSLQEAATCATNILFFDRVNSDTNCTPATGAKQLDNVKIGIVPFTTYVNVGAGNATKPWIDNVGTLPNLNGLASPPSTLASPISNDNFFTDTPNVRATGKFTDPVNRLALYDQITNDKWRGCVEARPHLSSGSSPTEFLDTDDTPPSSGNPASKYVPLFAPDMPDTLQTAGTALNNYVSDSPPSCDRPSANGATSCTMAETRTGCNSSNNNCTASTVTKYTYTGPENQVVAGYGYVGPHAASCECRSWGAGTWVDKTGSGSNRTFTRTRTCSNGYIPTGLSNRQLQERLCKYNGAIDYTTDQRGPNADCPTQAIMPLGKEPAPVRTAIKGMVASGGTNIHEGTAWGFRALSPGEPFPEGNPYQEATSKIMIVMTDGENTAYNIPASQTNYCADTLRTFNGSCYYSAYGFPYNSRNTDQTSSSGTNIERLGSNSSTNGSIATTNAQLVTEMNTRTMQTCTNAKAKGITVYVIGLATSKATQSTPAVVQNMLTQCASSTSHVFFPENSSELKSVFQKIAGELAALRLAR